MFDSILTLSPAQSKKPELSGGMDHHIIADADAKLRRIDPETLDYGWGVGDDVFGAPIIVGRIVAAPTTDGVIAADISRGHQLWHPKLEDLSAYEPDTLAYHNDVFWFAAANGELFGLLQNPGETTFSMAANVRWIGSSSNGVVVGEIGQTSLLISAD